MTVNEIQTTIDELDLLLDREREALLAGELEVLSGIHDTKTTLIDRLNKLDVEDHDTLVALREKVGRNQDLLNSALEGIRAVSKRLAAVRRVRSKLETYTASGEKTEVETQTDHALEKRA
ncbi:MAG: flagellar biosynthesis protein FlgN [Paracoccaceae bacterium]